MKVFALLFFIFLSCNNHGYNEPVKDPAQGGPCDYRTDTLPIIVTKITKEGTANYQLDFLEPPADTLSAVFNEENARNSYRVDLFNVRIGDTFQVIKQVPAHGYCKTSFTVELIKYKVVEKASSY